MYLKIDKELLAYLGLNRVRIDELFTVMCMNLNRLDMLKTFLLGRTGDQCIAFMQSLVRKKLVRTLSNIDSFDWDNYMVTEEGNSMYEDCIGNLMENDIVDVPSLPLSRIMVEDDTTLITRFMELWPPDARNINGDKLLSHTVDIEKKMKQFIKKYKFNTETIIAATTNYLNRQRMQGYQYCNQAHFFISKDNVSKLAGECDLVMTGVSTNTDAWENVM